MYVPRPVKAVKLVVEALRHLRNERGFKPKEVINYIEANYGINERGMKCVLAAIKRGTDYGILSKKQDRYALKMTHTLPLLMAKKKRLDWDEFEDACKKRRSRRRRKSRSRRHRRSRSRCGRRGKSRRRRARRSRSRKRSGSCKRRGSRRRRASRRRRRSGRKCRGHGRRHARRRRSRSRRRRARC